MRMFGFPVVREVGIITAGIFSTRKDACDF